MAPNAVDGDPSTAWRTMTYLQDFGPGGLKTGAGLVLDLGAEHDVGSVDLTFVGVLCLTHVVAASIVVPMIAVRMEERRGLGLHVPTHRREPTRR